MLRLEDDIDMIADFMKLALSFSLPQTSDYYWDKPVPPNVLSAKVDSSTFPPDGMDLGDTWVIAIVSNLGISGRQRHKRWPAVFLQKYLHSEYKHKGQPSKSFSATRNGWFYNVAFGIHQFHGIPIACKQMPCGFQQRLMSIPLVLQIFWDHECRSCSHTTPELNEYLQQLANQTTTAHVHPKVIFFYTDVNRCNWKSVMPMPDN